MDDPLRLLHLLVLVYWLGGDLGAFVASGTVLDRKAPPAVRLFAAKLVGAVDMAPRTCLILAAPTGLSLALARGWITAPTWLEPSVWIAAIGWLILVWRQHLAHGAPGAVTTGLDVAIRIGAIAALASVALFPAPLFITLKCGLLAAAIAAGLAVRIVMRPFGAALGTIAAGAATDGAELALAQSLRSARAAVVFIWLALLAAAWLGVSTPT